MRTKILIGLLIAGVVVACKKDAFNTKPTIKVKSLSTKVVPLNGSLIVDLEVNDKEGDVGDTAVLFQRKVRLNQRVDTSLTATDSLYFRLPTMPNTQQGVIEVLLSFDYLQSTNPPQENDTLVFKYALKDREGNVSDTVTTDPVVVIRL